MSLDLQADLAAVARARDEYADDYIRERDRADANQRRIAAVRKVLREQVQYVPVGGGHPARRMVPVDHILRALGDPT